MERYTEDALMSDMILCLRELDNREQPNTCRVLAKLATDYTKNMADAQATVEALQRERDQWKEAFERSCDDTAHLKATLDATTPTTHEQAKATVFNEWDGALRKMADVEQKGGNGE